MVTHNPPLLSYIHTLQRKIFKSFKSWQDIRLSNIKLTINHFVARLFSVSSNCVCHWVVPVNGQKHFLYFHFYCPLPDIESIDNLKVSSMTWYGLDSNQTPPRQKPGTLPLTGMLRILHEDRQIFVTKFCWNYRYTYILW